MTTIKLTDASDVAHFEVGERHTIDDFDYETACAIFGKPLVDAYWAWKENPPKEPHGIVTLVSIDSAAGTLTFDPEPGAAPCSTPAPPKEGT